MLKDIVVHVDGTPEAAARIETACSLAVRHNAHLIGVFVVHHPPLPGYVRSQIGEKVLAAAAEAARIDAAAVGKTFKAQCDRAGIAAEFRQDEGDLLDRLRTHARYADLTVIGQHSGESMSAGRVPERLVLEAGRPALVVPASGKFPVTGETVLVAWDGGRPATRAVNDALSILAKAKTVHVVVATSHHASLTHGDVPGADISLHLARHGIKVEASPITIGSDIDVGNALLSRATDVGADMLVMGAYGHARLRELVLGGVTRLVMESMTLPVFMSH